MSRIRMVIMKDWLEQIEKRCNEKQTAELLYRMLKYGIHEEYKESEDPIVNVMLDLYCPQIDAMQEAYEIRTEQSKKGGRPQKVDNQMVWQLAKEGHNGADIAGILGVPKTTIYSCAGWKNRDRDYYE